MSVLAVDVGTSGVRAAIVRPDSSVDHVHYRQVLPSSPAPGFVEFDAAAMAEAVLEVAAAALAAGGSVDAVGITNQRASTVAVGPRHRRAGRPGDRLAGPAHGRLLPGAPGSGDPPRAQPERDQAGRAARHRRSGPLSRPVRGDGRHLGRLDAVGRRRPRLGPEQPRGHRPARRRRLGVGRQRCSSRLRIPPGVLPAAGRLHRRRRRGERPAGLLPRSPASPATSRPRSSARAACGRAWPRRPSAPAGCSTSASATTARSSRCAGPGGTFPIVAWSAGGTITWGIEAIMLSAGSCVEWLRDDLGILSSAAESDELAASCADSGGVWFVPALLGLGTPVWDYGARGTLARPDPGIGKGRGRPSRARGDRATAARISSRRPRPIRASRSGRSASTAA